jgi:hypothetical protein
VRGRRWVHVFAGRVFNGGTICFSAFRVQRVQHVQGYLYFNVTLDGHCGLSDFLTSSHPKFVIGGSARKLA